MRVSLVSSPTRVTTVSGTMASELSVTVPLMPPRVCWPCAQGGKTRDNQRNATRRRTESLILLNITVPPGLKFPSTGCPGAVALPASRPSLGLEHCSPSIGRSVFQHRQDGKRILLITEISYFYFFAPGGERGAQCRGTGL